MLNNDNLVDESDALVSKQAWNKPELVVIEDTNATKASKPSNPTFEASPMWGVS